MIILFGLAGSGKSTQGQILAERHQMTWLSVGQVLREDGRFDAILKEGKLVDDNQAIALMDERIAKELQAGREVILDGFPRDVYQAEWFGKKLAKETSGAVLLEVPKEELLRRMEERGRADDTREVIERRFKIVEENIRAILEILEKEGVKVQRVSGVGEIFEVTRRLEEAFGLDAGEVDEREED
ncbi:nucleoside monophosphate kinase [Candidatus Saccharibacteria bacterium]|nr:nucleoside monophosphate kinase [Candidatus Saccharibacteria bacterium]